MKSSIKNLIAFVSAAALCAGVAAAQEEPSVLILWGETNELGPDWAAQVQEGLEFSLPEGYRIETTCYAADGTMPLAGPISEASIVIADGALQVLLDAETQADAQPPVIINLGSVNAETNCADRHLHINTRQSVGAASANYLAQHGVRRLFAYFADSDAGAVVEADFRDAWPRGFGGAQAFPTTESFFTPYVDLLGVTRSDGLFLGLEEPALSTFVNEMAVNPRLPDDLKIISTAVFDEALLSDQGKAMLERIEVIFDPHSARQERDQFVQSFEEANGQVPGELAMLGHESAVVVEALSQRDFSLDGVEQISSGYGELSVGDGGFVENFLMRRMANQGAQDAEPLLASNPLSCPEA